MPWLYYFILLVLLVFGLFINILGLPGLWLMVAALGGYALMTGWDVHVGWPAMIAMLVLAAAAEVVEFVAGAAGSKAAGGRKRGMVGAIVGGLLGGIFLSVIPIPIISTIVGACLGAFLGAAIMEFHDRDVAHSVRVGVGAAKGRFAGIVIKLAFGVAMMLVALAVALPTGVPVVNPTAPPAPAVPARAEPPASAESPATVPSTLP